MTLDGFAVGVIWRLLHFILFLSLSLSFLPSSLFMLDPGQLWRVSAWRKKMKSYCLSHKLRIFLPAVETHASTEWKRLMREESALLARACATHFCKRMRMRKGEKRWFWRGQPCWLQTHLEDMSSTPLSQTNLPLHKRCVRTIAAMEREKSVQHKLIHTCFTLRMGDAVNMRKNVPVICQF